jgi:hypothetical protein
LGSQEAKLWFVFNELSARNRAESQVEGRRRLDSMLLAIAGVMRGDPAELVSIGDQLWACELAVGYTVNDWLATADPELRGLLLGIATKTEFPVEAGDALSDRFHLSEFHLSAGAESEHSPKALGLGAAYLLHGVGASMPSEPRWTQTRLALRHVWLDDGGRDRENTVEVLNLAEPIQAAAVSDVLLQRKQHALASDPLELATRKEERFPHLRFGSAVDRQIRRLPTTLLRRVVLKLMVLDHASREWRQDSTMPWPQVADCRSESEPTMEQYGHLRIFPDHEGRNRTYELHMSIGQRHRIHVLFVPQPRVIEVGYVGRHLPTVKHH